MEQLHGLRAVDQSVEHLQLVLQVPLLALQVAQPNDIIHIEPDTYPGFDCNVGVRIRALVPGPVTSHILDPIHFAPGTQVPDATQQIFNAMNSVHQRVLAGGDAAAVDDGDG